MTARIAAVLSLLALLSPYGVIWINSRREKRKAEAHKRNLDDAGRRMITDACTAIEFASNRHSGTSLGVSELWRDLSKLSGQRNVLKVYLDAGDVSHNLLMGISEALQINYATRDALIMRDPAGTSNAPNQTPDSARSDAVLKDVVIRTGELRKIL